MKYLFIAFFVLSLSYGDRISEVPEHFKKVDQMLWVVKDLDNVIAHWGELGFTQIVMLDTVVAEFKKTGKTVRIRLAKANLAGSNINPKKYLNTGTKLACLNFR